jgi:aspartyl-tRNA synthetase
LQIRFDNNLKERLIFRHKVNKKLRDYLDSRNFVEYETPQLFKSTPEGAREFLVPTRRRGFAYALPQSPQQYKQLLMASGVEGYFQFARCFRDEDLRADRQPEFTQLDMEMSFAKGEDVMQTVEAMIKHLLKQVEADFAMEETNSGELVLTSTASPSSRTAQTNLEGFWAVADEAFPRITYQQAMTDYGSDKPDVRIPCKIQRLESFLPAAFVSMVTDLNNPIVEAIKFRLEPQKSELADDPVSTARSFVKSFMDNDIPKALAKNPDGAPAVLVFDTTKPMQGMSALGHEAYDNLTSLPAFSDLEDGDILFIQARENAPFSGGSTALGQLRLSLYASALKQGLLPPDHSFRFLWVTGFPMFTLDSSKDSDPGQGGTAGFSATHHPFTAPLTQEDFAHLATDPLQAKADHYDLVVNGVELGGGSRRIHVAQVQEYVLRHILQMPDQRVAQFEHLLEALRAGCPPHAGFALGFDRLVAVLSGTSSVRDVIAFPKSMKGEDLMVKAPGKVTEGELATYHLRPTEKGGSPRKGDGSGELKEAVQIVEEKLTPST